jgi:hypothetical protein
MSRTSRVLRVAALCGAVSASIVSGAQASNDEQVLICHGTASDTNPYVLISVDESALNGHFDGAAPGHGKNNHPDFLAGSDGSCGGEE